MSFEDFNAPDGLVRSFHGSGRSGHYDLDSKCFKCRRIAYDCMFEGEWTLSGFICMYCILMMDGESSLHLSRFTLHGSKS